MFFNKYRSYFSEGVWLVLGQIASVTGSLIIVRVLTETISPSEYGILSLALTVPVMGSQIVMSRINPGVARLYSVASEQNNLVSYLATVRKLVFAAMVVIMLSGVSVVVGMYAFGFAGSISICLAALTLALIGAYNGTVSAIQNAARQRSIVAFHSGLEPWLKVVLLVSLSAFVKLDSLRVTVVYIFASLLLTISQVILLRRTIPFDTGRIGNVDNKTNWASEIALYSWPFAIWGVFSCLQQVSDRWALEVFSTKDNLGQYVLLFQLGYSPIIMVLNVAGNFFTPILFQRSGDATNSERNKLTHVIAWKLSHLALGLTVVGFCVSLLFHKTIISIFAAREYHATSYLLPWLILAGGVYSSSQMLALKLMSEMKPRTMFWCKVVTSALAILFNILGACFGGVYGIVFAVLCFAMISYLWMVVICRRGFPGLNKVC